MSDPKIEFVDELPEITGKGRSSKHSHLADELRQNPGKWAKWPFPVSISQAYALTSQINNDGRVAFPSEEFEAVTRQKTVYIRCKEKS